MDNEITPPQNPAPDAAAPDISASFWLRAGAYMIDGLIVVIISIVPSLLLPEGLRAVVQLLIAGAYFTLMPVARNGQTLGKMAAGVAIVRENGAPLTHGRACARWASYLLSNLTLCLGFLCAAFTPHKRALHDYIAGTRVVRVEELGFGRKLAVVLVGLLFPAMIVLGIVAAIAIPNFNGLKSKADEGAAKGRLGSLRAANAMYYGDTEGNYPSDLNALVPKYVAEIAPAAVPSDGSVPGVEIYGPEVCSATKELLPEKLRGTGKWGYVVARTSPCDGQIFIDSTHTDSKGSAWYAY